MSQRIPETCGDCPASHVTDHVRHRGYCTDRRGPHIALHLDMPPQWNVASDSRLTRTVRWVVEHVCGHTSPADSS